LKTLVETFSKLPDLNLKIVGAGNEKAFILDYIKTNSIRNIELSGYKKGDELKEIISGASFVIVPSECYENNPMTIIEAYTHGIPVIGSSIGGIPEIIDEGKTGFLFEPKDTDSLTQKLKLARSLSKREYQNMSENALLFADKNFNPEIYYNRLIEFYQEVGNKYKIQNI
jgi:glycosyltransferase involved in cell wall biosynthesis